MAKDEQFYDKDQLRLWGFILQEWLNVRDRYSIIPTSVEKDIGVKMSRARQIADELVEKLKKGKTSVMKDPDDIDPLEDILNY